MKKLFLFALVLSSCTPLYIPNSRNSPMFTKAGEFQMSGSMMNGLEAQTALSVSKHFGLIANYSYAKLNSPFSAVPEQRHKFFEGGAGYFKNDKEMFYEIFGGYGKGEVSNASDSGRYERFFLQPGVGTTYKKAQISFVTRVSVVNFQEFFSLDATDPEIIKAKVFFEPAVITRVNLLRNRAFLTFQTGTCSTLGEKSFFRKSSLQASFGLGFRLGGLKPEQIN